MISPLQSALPSPTAPSEKNVEKNPGNWEMNLEEHRLSWSPDQYRIYGYEPHELRLDDDFFIINTTHPSDIDRISAIVNRSLKHEEGYNFKRRIIKKDGSFGFVQTEARIIRSVKHIPVKIIGTTTDIQGQSAEGTYDYSDPLFFNRFYKDYKKAILSEIHKWTFDADLSKDLCQEVFLKAWHHMHSYNPAKGGLYTWLINIARNHCKDYLKSKYHRYKQLSRPMDLLGETISDNREEIGSLCTHQLLFSLSVDLRETVELVFIQGFTQEDVARIKNIPLGTVKTKCRTAIQKMRTALQAA
ncbi:MAG: sigma-70 family RNA polymerase sigma factor [Bacteroidia bacterium]|nr:sigma-70 family RNA polymerase sigma factor [Bacteroidia bacterium]